MKIKPPVSFYVASRATEANKAMWRGYRAAGHNIISSWIDAPDMGGEDLHQLWTQNLREVIEARALILYAEPNDFPLKGALIEVGAALTFCQNVYIVAPGVVVDPKTCRPLGSWIYHPKIVMAPTITGAINHETFGPLHMAKHPEAWR